MKSNTGMAYNRLKTVLRQIGTLMVVTAFIINTADAIRVYHGTNFASPVSKLHKSTGLTKKSLLISKRSWNSDDYLRSKEEERIDGKWKEINKRTAEPDIPSLYKIKFFKRVSMQYLKYIQEVPRLEEYTFCMWYMPKNLTHDQTLFSYSLNKKERLLRFWLNAVDLTLRMAIRDIVVYKVPTNIRQYKWHHVCQSWNGVLGEWQVFLDGKSVGAGVLPHYEGTYIPEGGEVTIGQEQIGLEKGLNDGIDGEIFGFNLVDESVPHDQANFINSQYRPNLLQQAVPPFKKLPPIKKTYQEIKAYISALPSDLSELRKGSEALAFRGEEPNVIGKIKEPSSVPPKRNRGNHRVRYPPLRKVVVYNRDDRQFPINDAIIEINKTNAVLEKTRLTPVASAKNRTTSLKTKITKASQSNDENHSIHSYRLGKDERKSANYEIYEVLEDDLAKSPEDDKSTDVQSMQRKARQNFNLYRAREANKVYTLSNSVRDLKKPIFHFETRLKETSRPENGNQKSFQLEETKTREVRKRLEETIEKAERKMSDSIPVYEIEIPALRQKRSTKEGRDSRQFAADDPLTDANGFRRLPQIPDSFINIFTKNASRTEIEQELNQFFPNVSTESITVVTQITETPKTHSPTTDTLKLLPVTTVGPFIDEVVAEKVKTSPRVQESTVPPFVPIKVPVPGEILQINQALYAGALTETKPINFPLAPDQEFNVREVFEGTSSSNWYTKPRQKPEVENPTANRRKFDVSSGTDLIMRSYGLCTTDRGSPVQDMRHLVISWADTPVRIFGGAQVESARNECGNF